jgi:hypothetical protein
MSAAHPAVKAASSIAIGGGAALAASWPPDWVLLAALFGAVLSVWTSALEVSAPSVRWALGVLGQYLMAVTFGAAGSTALMSVAPLYDWLAPAAAIPHALWALGLAWGTQHILPVLGRAFARRVA